MKSKTTRSFRDRYKGLPKDIRSLARKAYRLFSLNPNHPSLQFKKLNSSKPLYSARVGLYYRVIGRVQEDTMIWYWIGTHAEYDTLLRSLGR